MATEINFERAVLSIDSAAIIVSRSKPACSSRAAKAARSMKDRSVTGAILLTLRHNEFYIR